MKRESDKVIFRAMNLFFILFLGVGFALGGIVAIFYRAETSNYINDLKTEEKHAVDLQVKIIEDEFESVVKDVLFLTKQNELASLLSRNNTDSLSDIQKEYLQMSTLSRVYDQIRFLDSDGHEVVRVNYNKGAPSVVPEAKLQNKGKRYYFTDCYRLSSGEIFVSPLDLNIENGRVELPLKPMIRFGTPVFDSLGNKRGIILTNYLAGTMLDRISASGENRQSRKTLLNSEGYWLIGPDKSVEWGFMFDDRQDKTFAADYPEEWKKILTENSGQFQTSNGLFTFSKIYPLEEGHRSSSGSGAPYTPSVGEIDPSQYFWVLLSRVSPGIMKNYTSNLMFRLFMVGGGLFVVVAFGAWHLALAVTKRRIYQAQLVSMAMYDSLTGLPNRKLFFDRMEAGISQADRFKRKLGLLYIDLDGFKNVNDTMGHDAGDELLIRVGEVLTKLVRKSDTAARLGGDEFAVVLTETTDVAGAKIVGDKIVEALCVPFELKSGTAHIGASVGVAVYPDHEDSMDRLIKAADQAMYESKKLGKNTCTITIPPDSE